MKDDPELPNILQRQRGNNPCAHGRSHHSLRASPLVRRPPAVIGTDVSTIIGSPPPLNSAAPSHDPSPSRTTRSSQSIFFELDWIVSRTRWLMWRCKTHLGPPSPRIRPPRPRRRGPKVLRERSALKSKRSASVC